MALNRTRTHSCEYKIYNLNTGELFRPVGEFVYASISDDVNSTRTKWNECLHWTGTPTNGVLLAPNGYGYYTDIYETTCSNMHLVVGRIPYNTHISSAINAPQLEFQRNDNFKALQLLAELDGTLELFKQKFVTKTLKVVNLGSVYLTGLFGYGQVISDALALAQTFYDLNSLIRSELLMLRQSKRVRFKAKPVKVTLNLGWGTLKYEYTVSFDGEMRYTGPIPENVSLAILLDELGFNEPFLNLWAITKWSWLIDWVSLSFIPRLIRKIQGGPLRWFNPEFTFTGGVTYKADLELTRLGGYGSKIVEDGRFFYRTLTTLKPKFAQKPLNFSFISQNDDSIGDLITVSAALIQSKTKVAQIDTQKLSRLAKKQAKKYDKVVHRWVRGKRIRIPAPNRLSNY